MTTPTDTPEPGTGLVARPDPAARAALTAAQNEELSAFSVNGFLLAQKIADALAASDLVPDSYRGKPANCLIAIDMANRMRVSPMVVMQNLHIISGRPSWGSPFLIASLNSCGRFSPLRYEVEDLPNGEFRYDAWEGPKGNRQKATRSLTLTNNMRCRAWAYDLTRGDRGDREPLYGSWVSMEMAIREGWYTKNDSKWLTMPDQMIRYRAAAFFTRLYAPEIAMGLLTADEVRDTEPDPTLTAEVEDAPRPGPRRPKALEAVIAQAQPATAQSVAVQPAPAAPPTAPAAPASPPVARAADAASPGPLGPTPPPVEEARL